MRFAFFFGLLAACSTDTFATDDGGTSTDGGGTDVISPSADAKVDANPSFDPSTLGSSLALWLDASDAQTGDAGDLVVAWPDRQHKYTTQIQPGGGTTGCVGLGLHTRTEGSIDNRPVVTFCNAILSIADAPGLHLGTAPFYIAAVIQAASQNGTGDVLFTKTAQGSSAPTSLTLVAPNPSGGMQGILNANSGTSSLSSLDQQFAYVGFVRTSASAIQVRVNGQPGASVNANASDDVSFAGNDFEIGGYRFDAGQFHNPFRGELAELLVVTDPSRIAAVETYFKNKYKL